MIIVVSKKRLPTYILSFSYNQELIDIIKKYERSKFDYDKKLWKVYISDLWYIINNFKGRKDVFFNFGNLRDEFLAKKDEYLEKDRIEKEKHEQEVRNLSDAIAMRETLSGTAKRFKLDKYLKEPYKPYPYQQEGAVFANKMQSVLLGMDMGLGKTLTSILACEMDKNSGKVLIISPASLLYNWKEEIKKFFDKDSIVLDKKAAKLPLDKLMSYKYFIISYGMVQKSNFCLSNDFYNISLNKFQWLILEESHLLKNPSANKFKNIKKIFAKKIPKKILLSGTPIPNKVIEIYSQLHLIYPTIYRNKKQFYQEILGWEFNGFEYAPIKGEYNFDKLERDLSGIMYRVKREDVLPELPSITIQNKYIDFSSIAKEEYDRMFGDMEIDDYTMDQIIHDLVKQKADLNKITPIIGQLTNLRIQLANYKIDFTAEMIDDLHDAGEKVVVFDFYKEPLKKLQERYQNTSLLYTGEVSSTNRQEMVNKFQNDSDTNLLLLTIGAGNFGITLTKASYMIMNTLSYVPSQNDQAYARIHRIGQTNPVNIYNMIVKNSLDEKILYILNRKDALISQVVG